MALLCLTETEVGIDLQRLLWRRVSRGNVRAIERLLLDCSLRCEVPGLKPGTTSCPQVCRGESVDLERIRKHAKRGAVPSLRRC